MLFAGLRQTPLISSTCGCVLDMTLVGLAGGHYYTYARTLSKVKVAEWYNYNDSYVSRIHNPEEVRTPCAYVLFYQRRGWNGGRGVAGQGQ
jgi:hypothetical protein